MGESVATKKPTSREASRILAARALRASSEGEVTSFSEISGIELNVGCV
jgi:hypothetical protein